MTPSLREQFERLAMRLTELDATLTDPQVSSDIKRYRAIAREQAEVADVVAHLEGLVHTIGSPGYRPEPARLRERLEQPAHVIAGD